MSDRTLHPVRRLHLERITGPLGIWQHAEGDLPSPVHGYCTDDVARALVVDLLHRRAIGWEAVSGSAWRSLTFLREAYNPATGWFRNFRAADGTWLDDVGSEDTQGRAAHALGLAASVAPEVAMRREAATLFGAALPGVRRLEAPRAVAAALLGCDAVLDNGRDGWTERTLSQLAARLRRAFGGVDLRDDWPWPEGTLTYETALVPHGLIVAGRRTEDAALGRHGLRVLDWLVRVQTSATGAFSPVGNDGWWVRGGRRARFDQQPIEAATLVVTAVAAFEATRDDRYRRAAELGYAWFLGGNDAGLVVADVVTGGCHDGLSATAVNDNQGAESTLMWQTALESIRRLRARAAVESRAPVAVPA